MQRSAQDFPPLSGCPPTLLRGMAPKARAERHVPRAQGGGPRAGLPPRGARLVEVPALSAIESPRIRTHKTKSQNIASIKMRHQTESNHTQTHQT